MAIDMKKIIAQETRTLLFDKKVKKLTVKDIVDACHITRQSFYYHFADISELLKWMLEQTGNELKELLMQSMQDLFCRLARKQGALQEYTPFEQEFMARYHCQAIMGILQSWTDEDTQNMDQIVHAVFLAMSKGIAK